jgi:dynein assembly factor with WDR repeat domains 1
MRQLRRVYVRYYPPGLVFELQNSDTITVDLLTLNEQTDIIILTQSIIKNNQLKKTTSNLISQLLTKLIQKQNRTERYKLLKTIRSHILPLTNCAYNKQGDQFITGSYDRTCRVFDGTTGEERLVLEGHKNVVYAVAFNYPKCDRIVTGSFDKTAKLWNANTGELIETFVGHSQEVVSVACAVLDTTDDSLIIATGSMDGTARLWVVSKNEQIVLEGHTGEIVSVVFSYDGKKLLTSSFDMTARIWDVQRAAETTSLMKELRMGDSKDACLAVLAGHVGELSVGLFSFDSRFCLTGSTDRTVRLWSAETGVCVEIFKGHSDEVVDVAMTTDARLIASASADGTAKIWDVKTAKLVATLVGHSADISRLVFAPNGKQLLTGSGDKTLKIWDVQTGVCLQTLEGHQDEIFSCMFNYWGDRIISASKDNTCKVWTIDDSYHFLCII